MSTKKFRRKTVLFHHERAFVLLGGQALAQILDNLLLQFFAAPAPAACARDLLHAAAKAVEARHETWKERLPKVESGLWDALTALDGNSQASLFAHCASFAVNALYEPANRTNQGRVSAHGVRARLDQTDVLARAVGLDMVQAGWAPTVDNYLGRVTKPRILDAVREAKGEASAQLIDHLKKADMAKEAERLLDGSGWLPEPLRLADVASAPVEQESEVAALPEFLSEDEDRDAEADEGRPQLDAAE